ncbi:hypothetical protein NDU88_000302 [Pleurodeles waltl]|uniref:Gypsy retrotransposon integrase-like protein 1 n=1 Tax=Pleurodeles waltl TaxID=8319 RepID=A0AAV7TFD2_PLEWA|nr:hypothetical protein NDU88_000302 [Pleurodeles waltl]
MMWHMLRRIDERHPSSLLKLACNPCFQLNTLFLLRREPLWRNPAKPRRPASGPQGKPRSGSRVTAPAAALFSGRVPYLERGRARDPELGRGPRCAQRARSSDEGNEATEDFVQMIVHKVYPKALTAKEIKEAKEKDESIARMKGALAQRQWQHFLDRSRSLMQVEQTTRNLLRRSKNELSEKKEGLLLSSRQIVMPLSLWARVIVQAHQGHQAVVKTKARLCRKDWFPKMDTQVVERVSSCHSCAITSADSPPALVLTEEPSLKPWAKSALTLEVSRMGASQWCS